MSGELADAMRMDLDKVERNLERRITEGLPLPLMTDGNAVRLLLVRLRHAEARIASLEAENERRTGERDDLLRRLAATGLNPGEIVAVPRELREREGEWEAEWIPGMWRNVQHQIFDSYGYRVVCRPVESGDAG